MYACVHVCISRTFLRGRSDVPALPWRTEIGLCFIWFARQLDHVACTVFSFQKLVAYASAVTASITRIPSVRTRTSTQRMLRVVLVAANNISIQANSLGYSGGHRGRRLITSTLWPAGWIVLDFRRPNGNSFFVQGSLQRWVFFFHSGEHMDWVMGIKRCTTPPQNQSFFFEWAR